MSELTQRALADPDAFFEEHATHDPRRGSEAYAIAFNGYGYVSDDMMKLRKKFVAAVNRYRRSLRRRAFNGQVANA